MHFLHNSNIKNDMNRKKKKYLIFLTYMIYHMFSFQCTKYYNKKQKIRAFATIRKRLKTLKIKIKIRAFSTIRKRLKSICTLNPNLSFPTKIDRIRTK